jgi:RNA polymerase sigma factor, sigma-70 family
MEYMEVDLKQERFVQDQEAGTAVFLPSREDSYDRLQDEEYIQFAMDELTPEAIVVRREEIRLLWIALRQLEPEEYDLIQSLYFRGMSERKLSKQTGIPQQTINDRRRRAIDRLKVFLKNN